MGYNACHAAVGLSRVVITTIFYQFVGRGGIIWEVVHFLNAQLWMPVHIQLRTQQLCCQLFLVYQVFPSSAADLYSDPRGRMRKPKASVEHATKHYNDIRCNAS